MGVWCTVNRTPHVILPPSVTPAISSPSCQNPIPSISILWSGGFKEVRDVCVFFFLHVLLRRFLFYAALGEDYARHRKPRSLARTRTHTHTPTHTTTFFHSTLERKGVASWLSFLTHAPKLEVNKVDATAQFFMQLTSFPASSSLNH